MGQPGKQKIGTQSPLGTDRHQNLPEGVICFADVKLRRRNLQCKPNYMRFGNGKRVIIEIKSLQATTLRKKIVLSPKLFDDKIGVILYFTVAL